MAARDFSQLTIARWLKGLSDGAWRVSELVRHYLQQIEKINPELNAYLEVFDDTLAVAEAVDRRLARGDRQHLIAVVGGREAQKLPHRFGVAERAMAGAAGE